MPTADASAKELVNGHVRLVKLLRLAYSAERAAAYAYIGHAGSVDDAAAKAALTQIEADEWEHRAAVLDILRTYDIPVSRVLEVRFFLIGS
jgi:rubrerythrin